MNTSKYDKKTIFTLIAFILVGILLFATIYVKNKKDAENIEKNLPKNDKNIPVSETGYYGSEAIRLAGTVYLENGQVPDFSSIKSETTFYDMTGNPVNLPTVSPAEYELVKENMSYADVCNLIGGEGEITKEIDKPGDKYYTVCYFFYGDKANSSASFIFQGDNLLSKANTNIIEDKK